MATIRIGGEDFSVGQLSYYQIEKAWPRFKDAAQEPDAILATGHYIAFVCAILEDDNPAFNDVAAIKKKMKMGETNALANSVRQVLVENQMIEDKPAAGEPQPVAPADPSTETAPLSSVS